MYPKKLRPQSGYPAMGGVKSSLAFGQKYGISSGKQLPNAHEEDHPSASKAFLRGASTGFGLHPSKTASSVVILHGQNVNNVIFEGSELDNINEDSSRIHPGTHLDNYKRPSID